MNQLVARLCAVAFATTPTASLAATTIAYVVTSDATDLSRPPVHAEFRASIEIDGPRFRIRHRGLESSDDDGATTWFGDDRFAMQSPLAPPSAAATESAPIVGTIEGETLVVGPSSPGPERFGLATRVYTIDYDYTIGGRALIVPLRSYKSHAHVTMTVVDGIASPAAVRVLLSRGYNHALALRADAFTGLPVRMEGTIEGEASHVAFALDAVSLAR